MAEQLNAALTVWLDGASMDDLDERLLRLEVDERCAEASSVELELSMAPGDDGEWDLLRDGGRFQLMQRLTVALKVSAQDGAPVAERVVFDGYVTVVEPFFGAQRVPESRLRVLGLDASCVMHFEARTRTWKDQSDSAIVRSIYESYGFAVQVDEQGPTRSDAQDRIVQRGTDAEFVRHLARRHGWECNTRPVPGAAITKAQHPGKQVAGHFHPPRLETSPQPALSLEPADAPSLREFTARWDSHRPTRIDSWHIDRRSRRRLSSTWPRTDRGKQETLKRGVPKQGRLDRAEVLAPRLKAHGVSARGLQFQLTPQDGPELEQLGWADYLPSQWLAEGHGVVEGLRYPGILEAGRPVTLEGAGELLNGPWYLRRARHEWTANLPTQRYRVEVDLVRNALGATDG